MHWDDFGRDDAKLLRPDRIRLEEEPQVGDWVRHDKFGAGEVLEVYGSKDGAGEVVVHFTKGGPKRLLLKYAPLEKMVPDWEIMQAGDTVRHDQFGVGEVLEFGVSDDVATVLIDFNANGRTILPLRGLPAQIVNATVDSAPHSG